MYKILVSLIILFLPSDQTLAQTEVLLGVFDGRTPCRELGQRLKEKVSAECIKIKWRLHLFMDSSSGHPTQYTLQGFVYKRDSPRMGTWQIVKGTPTHPNAIVYQLNSENDEPLYFLKADENVLLFLDKTKRIMVVTVTSAML